MKIFKNKSYIRLYAFVTACLIILTLLLSGLNVCASDTIDFVSVYGFDDFYLESDSGINSLNNWSTLDNPYGVGYVMDKWNYFLNNDTALNHLDISQNHVLDTSIFNNYAIFTYRSYQESEDGCYFYIYQLPENSMIFSDVDSGNIIMIPYDVFSSNNIDDYYAQYAQFYGSSYSAYSRQSASNLLSYNENSLYYCNGVAYVGIYSYPNAQNVGDWGMDNIPYYMNSTVPVYYYDDISNFPHQFSTANLDNENPNYSSTSPGEDSTNNMYFKNYNISYSVSGLKDGNIVCYGDLNDYQKEHLDEFALTYSFNFEYYVYNPTVSGYKYNFTKNYSYQQTLSDFYNNGSSKVFTLKDIMQNINTQDIDSEYGNLYQLVSYLSNTGNNENIEYIWSKAKMKTTVFIVSANNSPSDILNSSDLHSNSFSKAYNFLDGKSSTYSDGITNNNNPYESTETGSISDQNELNNMPNGVSSSDIPSSQGDNGGSGTSVVTGDNNIVINNNPTFNNDGSVSGSGGGSSDGGVASTFYNTFNPFKTLFSSLNGDNSVISDDTAETIGSNRFISVMSSTFSFIPEGMWTALTTFLIASLSILIVAVVIRVLLDLL